MARSLNKVELIGNVTKDVELRYTPQGTAVCTFSIATNRQWTTDQGEKKEDAEFHRIVAWNKMAELCGQLITKGRKVYVEGRLQTRKWTDQATGTDRFMTEVVISDMILLDSRGASGGADFSDIPDDALSGAPAFDGNAQGGSGTTSTPAMKPVENKKSDDDGGDDDIPF